MSSSVPCDVHVGSRAISGTLGENTKVEASPFVRKSVSVPSVFDNSFRRSSTGMLLSLAIAWGTKINRAGRPTTIIPNDKDKLATQVNKRRGTGFNKSVTIISKLTSVE